MNWNRLKNMKCPKCTSTKLLEYDPAKATYYCQNKKKCGYYIGKEAFDRTVVGLYRRNPIVAGAPFTNIEQLNNL